MTHDLRRSLVVPRPRDEVFGFFARPENLERLTPPWLSFRILTPSPVPMARDALIDYRIRMHGLPMRWRSRIRVYEPPHRFVDEQVRGPYRTWVHEHRFEACPEGTLVTDHVRYDAPGGRFVHDWFIARDLRRIFDYRAERMREILARG